MLWWGMFGFFTLVLVAVILLWSYAMYRDPAKPVSDHKARRIQSRWIWGGGVILPIASIIAILIFGIPAGHRMLPLPPEEGSTVLQVDVTGHQWWWEVRYPDTPLTLENELHIPAGQPVDIHLRTSDVIHSFWVPRLGGKLDTIPGRVNILRLQADAPGTYHGQCAEYCGFEHAHMQFTVTAHSPEDFEIWLEDMQND